MISSILFLIAGIFNAVMDTLSHHYSESVFSIERTKPHKEMSWWYKFTEPGSWMNAYHEIIEQHGPDSYIRYAGKKKMWFWGLLPKPAFTVNLWHLCKSLMLICICLGAALMTDLQFIDLVLAYFVDYNFYLYIIIKFVWLRAWFGLGFVTFYNYILKK